MIQFSGVDKNYDENRALVNINFSIEKGEMAFITGPSGAGKTTLLKLIYRSETPDRGMIKVAGWDLSKLKESTIPYLRRNVGVIFQDFRLLQNKTVFENVALALSIHGYMKSVIKEKTFAFLKHVGLRHKCDSFPQCLSGGEQQRVVIARAMVSEPTVLLADEPTGNLDPETASVIIKLFKEINVRGTTVLIATHSEFLYHGSGRKVLHVRNGTLVEEFIG